MSLMYEPAPRIDVREEGGEKKAASIRRGGGSREVSTVRWFYGVVASGTAIWVKKPQSGEKKKDVCLLGAFLFS